MKCTSNRGESSTASGSSSVSSHPLPGPMNSIGTVNDIFYNSMIVYLLLISSLCEVFGFLSAIIFSLIFSYVALSSTTVKYKQIVMRLRK